MILRGSAIIIAGSGMVEGGRILHHLQYIADPKNTIVLVGYQGEGTRGRDLINGAKEIRVFGTTYEVHAKIKMIDLFSAHADYNEILEWLAHFERVAQKKYFLRMENCNQQNL